MEFAAAGPAVLFERRYPVLARKTIGAPVRMLVLPVGEEECGTAYCVL